MLKSILNAIVSPSCFLLPAIVVAVSQFLTDSDRVLIETKTRELYISERNAGDEDYLLTVLLPCLIGK